MADVDENADLPGGKDKKKNKASVTPCSKSPFLSLGGRRKPVLFSRDVPKMEGLTQRKVSLREVCDVSCTEDPSGEADGPIPRRMLSNA